MRLNFNYWVCCAPNLLLYRVFSIGSDVTVSDYPADSLDNF